MRDGAGRRNGRGAHGKGEGARRWISWSSWGWRKTRGGTTRDFKMNSSAETLLTTQLSRIYHFSKPGNQEQSLISVQPISCPSISLPFSIENTFKEQRSRRDKHTQDRKPEQCHYFVHPQNRTLNGPESTYLNQNCLDYKYSHHPRYFPSPHHFSPQT